MRLGAQAPRSVYPENSKRCTQRQLTRAGRPRLLQLVACATQPERGARKNVRETPRMTDDCLHYGRCAGLGRDPGVGVALGRGP
jgi:hypothetical protein